MTVVHLLRQRASQDVLATPLATAVLPAPAHTTEGTSHAQAAAAYFDDVRATAGACWTPALLPDVAHLREEVSVVCAESHVRLAGNLGALGVLCVGVAALQTVAQANVTGPALSTLVPACPAALAHVGAGDRAAWDEWAVQELSADGEEVIGKTALPQYLVLGA